MSLIARLVELRASRASCALVQLQQAIDRVLFDSATCSDEQLERLCILRELAVLQMEELGPRVRRNPTLRDAIGATCRAYRSWSEQDAGSDDEQRSADELTVRVLELRTITELEVEATSPTVVLGVLR